MKKPISIEKLLVWTYRDELPKEQVGTLFLRPDTFAGSWGAITKTGLLGTEVQEPDIRNRYGLVPDFTAQASPHEDAVKVYQAVRRLGDLHLDLPADWNPLVDLGDFGVDGAAAIVRGLAALSVTDINGRRHLRDVHGPVHLVERAAIMGPPDWHFPKPVRKLVSHSNGKPRWFIKEKTATGHVYEAEGFDTSARRPKIGAYQKPYLDPDPIDAVVARGQYQIWYTALGLIVDDLADRLELWDVGPSAQSPYPWEDGDVAMPRILSDGTVYKPIVRMPRPLAGPPPFRGIERHSDSALSPIRRTPNAA